MRMMLLSAALLSGLCACATTITPIEALRLPVPKTIEGTITRLTEDGFVLKDHSGRIHVEMEKNKPENLETGEHVRVVGNVDEDDDDQFDAYQLIRADGVVIDAI